MKILFYPMLPSPACPSGKGLSRWRWIWSNGKMMLKGET